MQYIIKIRIKSYKKVVQLDRIRRERVKAMVLTDIDVEGLQNLQDIDKSRLEQYMDQLGNWLIDKFFDLVVAAVFLIIGFKLCKLLIRVIRRSFEKSGMEHSVSGFLLSLIRGILYAVVFIMAASIMGFQVTSLVTILGTASLAIGLALQGSLANFAGGILILLMKPFKVGDYIIENDKGCEGTVTSIDIFYTKLRTYDNKIVVIPNGNITSNSLINVTAAGTRKLDIQVGVSYDSDLRKVKDVLARVVRESQYYDEGQELDVFVDAFLDSSIRMGVRCFVKSEDYWHAKWEITEHIKTAFDEEGIIIPYNQMEVTVRS